MSYVHFAKFNFNEKIYEIYDRESRFNELLASLYQGINADIVIEEDDNTKYKFIHIDKNPETMTINGRLMSYSPGVTTEYDIENDDIVEEEIERQATYVTFSFDLNRELIGFVPKRDFGRKQFLNRFKKLVESSSDIGEVELILETDGDQLKEKLNRMNKVKEINAQLIPPNNDRELFRTLLSFSAEELKETNATKLDMGLRGSIQNSLDVSSEFVKKLIKATNYGYAKLVAKGENRNGETVIVDSEDDALYRRSIHNNSKDSIPDVVEKTRAGISHLSSIKVERLRQIETIQPGEEDS